MGPSPGRQTGGVRRLLVLSLVWGFSFLFIKVAVAGVTPATVAAARVGLGALALVVLLRAQGRRLPRDRRTWRHLAFMGVVGNAIPFTALAWGEEAITSALASVLNATTPLFTAAIAALWFRERLRPGQLLGLAVGLAGVAIATGLATEDVTNSQLVRAGGPILATLCYGIGLNYTKRHLLTVEPALAACGQLIAATVVLAPIAAITSITGGFELSTTRVASLVLLGVAGTGIAWVLFYAMVAELGPTRSSLVTYLVPLVAVTVGVIGLDEPLRSRLVVGGVLVIGGVLAVNQFGVLRWLRGIRPQTVAMLLVVLAFAGSVAGCGGDDGGDDDSALPETTTTVAASVPSEVSACQDPVQDPVDPQSFSHVVPGAPEPTFVVDPPTSGAHIPLEVDDPVVAEPISKPEQVGLLEAGNVLIQHRDLTEEERLQLVELTGPEVVMAPNPDLPDRIVATAWVHTLRCADVDPDTLADFIAAHAGGGPDSGH